MYKRSLPLDLAGVKIPQAEIKDGKIRAPSHVEDFAKSLYDMYVRSDGCDVTLVVETCTSPIKAHKAVLMACSDYFHAMFSHECTESETNVVKFAENIPSVGLKAVLEFAYTGWLPINEDSVRGVLEVARHFLMSDVTKLCEDFLISLPIPAEKYFWIYEIAREFKLSNSVKEQVVRHTRRLPISCDNYIEITKIALFCQDSDLLTLAVGHLTSKLPWGQSEKFINQVDGETLISILKRISHGVYTDVALIRFLTKWVGHSPNDRSALLPNILGEINLLCFDETELETISGMDYIKDNEKCREIIMSAKRQLTDLKISVGEDNPVLVLTDTTHLIFWSFQDEGDRKSDPVKIPLPTPLFRYGSQPNVSAIDGGLFIFNAYETRAANGHVLLHCFSFDPFRGRWTELAPLPHSAASFYGSEYDQFQKAEVINKGSYICVGLKNGQQLKKIVLFNINENKWSTPDTSIPYPNESYKSLFWFANEIHVCCKNYNASRFNRFNLSQQNWSAALGQVSLCRNLHLVAGESGDLIGTDLSNVRWYTEKAGWCSDLDREDAVKEFVIENVLQYKDSSIYFTGSIPSSDEARERKIARFVLSEDRNSWGLGNLYPCEFTFSGCRPCIINLSRKAYIFREEG